MSTNFVIVSHKPTHTSPLSHNYREFTKEQVDSGEMQQHIELKTKAGYICRKFDFSAAYKVESGLVESNH
jgi:hypothetical protein